MRGLLSRWLLLAGPLAWGCASFAATTNPWLLRVWQSDDGLPNNNITSLAQTSDGYVWLANPTHLARFDGVQFEEFTSRNIVEGHTEHISALLQSHDDGLWIAMDHGPVSYLRG